MAVVNVHEAKTQLSKLLERIEAGEEIVIARAGVPVARLTPVEPPQKRTLGFVRAEVPESFFEPLPDEELDAWE